MDMIIPISAARAAGKHPFKEYMDRVGSLLLDPKKFFREDYIHFKCSDAVAFGLIAAWISAFISFLWSTLSAVLLSSLFEKFIYLPAEEGVALLGADDRSFLFSAGLILLSPFLFLFQLVFSSLAIYFFTKLFTGKSSRTEISYLNIMSILGVSMNGAWFGVIPIFGGILSFFATMILTITGLRECFGISTRRAVAIVLAPYLVLLFMLLFFGLAFLFMLTQIPYQDLIGV